MYNNELVNQYYIVTQRAEALRVAEKVREIEAERERLIALGKLKKVVEYDPIQKLTTIRYIKIKK